ncbi:MAG: YvrJ protein family [bacterium]|nr:YvrJ protein family [bacterium]
MISNLGFPIVLSFYLLTRLEREMKELKEAIHQLSSAIEGNALKIGQ